MNLPLNNRLERNMNPLPLNFKKIKELFKSVEEAYLVGGGARYWYDIKCGAESPEDIPLPRDWDVLIDGHEQIPNLSKLLKRKLKYGKNSFGGRKYKELMLDVWNDNVGKYLREVPRGQDGIAIHLRTEAVLLTKEFVSGSDMKIEGRCL